MAHTPLSFHAFCKPDKNLKHVLVQVLIATFVYLLEFKEAGLMRERIVN
jgi:hypothetical protein